MPSWRPCGGDDYGGRYQLLLDVLIPDAPYGAASQQSLDTALQQGTLVLNEVVYAELAAHFLTLEELERFLADTSMRLVPSQPAALARAGRAWATYTRQRGTGFLRLPIRWHVA